MRIKKTKMRTIERIFIHCTASPQNWGKDELMREFKNKGWKNPGYHYAITKDGTVHQLLAIEEVSNGVQGYNSTSINVAYFGGIDAKGKPVDNRTQAQKQALLMVVRQLKKKFPKAKVMGHRSIWGEDTPSKWKKACPCFNAVKEYEGI